MSQGRIGFFCDFDGTISETDMIIRIVTHFVGDAARPIIEQVQNRDIPVAEGVAALFRLIPSREFDKVRQYALDTTVIRAGFSDFVTFCKNRGWMLNVVSGGFDFFVDPAMAPYQDDVRVYCNHMDASDEYLTAQFRFICDDQCDNHCGLCKPTVMRSLASEVDQRIVIGDGVTDLQGALRADFVFARASLLEECQKRNLPHTPFQTFHDIIRALSDPTSEVYKHVSIKRS